ncbi:hypothetical protein FZZ93_05860 [Halomonas eurihalina]|uniref:Uncharacterized protein n=1 Tax=Halomonas eurihalina TaxID=42566 RepID=A0A5D9DAF7_HALER|nr:hypothetical protein [Halomonas eurihalina]MDR5859391.1 hypothetical protein [Halomonas eurihalina]TZG40569.1 hypothetical protein FZZ93_05860 [Halomonas eurihalina]
MIDAILYIPDFSALLQELKMYHPEYLKQRTDTGEAVEPPEIVNLAHTPLIRQGDAAMTYVRLREHQVEAWRALSSVEMLARAEYVGEGTADVVYAQVLDDPERLATYDSVYDRTPREVPDGEGGTITCTPPDRFGIIAGA